jgi:hypothetical protein
MSLGFWNHTQDRRLNTFSGKNATDIWPYTQQQLRCKELNEPRIRSTKTSISEVQNSESVFLSNASQFPLQQCFDVPKLRPSVLVRAASRRIWSTNEMILTSENRSIRCHLIHHKSHVDWPGIEPGPAVRFQATNR